MACASLLSRLFHLHMSKERLSDTPTDTCILGFTTTQLLPDTHPLTRAAAWTKYHLAVTKHKDSEPFSTATKFDAYHPEAPVVSLDDFIDGPSVSPSVCLRVRPVDPSVHPHSSVYPSCPPACCMHAWRGCRRRATFEPQIGTKYPSLHAK
jgi:Copper amine oxidase, enzyme domain